MDDGGFDQGDPRDPRSGGAPNPDQLAGMLHVPQQRGDARDKRGPMGADGRDSRDVRTQTGRDATRGKSAAKLETLVYQGEARKPGPNSNAEEAKLTLEGDGLTLEVGGGRPIRASYRDLSLIAIQQSTAMIALGEGPDAMPWLLEKFADKLGPMVRELRERRLKQRLADGLVEVPDDPAELVEFAWTPTANPLGPGPDGPATPATGVGQFVIHPWGFVVCPVDERSTWIHYRRAAIANVTLPSPGEVVVEGLPGTLTLSGLGPAATRLKDTLRKLRDGAFEDASAFVAQTIPDASFGLRQKAEGLLVDGRPTRPHELGDGWDTVETAVLSVPEFAESLESLCSSAGESAPRWLATSPESPGSEDHKTWFLIAMPGNLVAMELVSAGSHATYFFRAMPRAQYKGEPPEKLGLAAEQCVRDVSEALVDIRFLREPIALPEAQLKQPKYLRYRLALAVLPSLSWARQRFVARIVHRDPRSWSDAVADLIKWHSGARDEAAEWPGRSAQESAIGKAGGDGGGDEGAGWTDDAGDGATTDAEAAGAAARKSKPSGPQG